MYVFSYTRKKIVSQTNMQTLPVRDEGLRQLHSTFLIYLLHFFQQG